MPDPGLPPDGEPTADGRASVPGAPEQPADRVREEGGSPALVRWTERIDDHVPDAGDHVGFWVSVYARFARHRGSVLAGGLAFFALLSLVPAVLSLGAVVAMFFDPAQFVASVEDALSANPDLLAALQPFLDQIAALSPTSPGSLGLAGFVGFALSLYAASRFLYVGRQVLDIAFELEPQHPSVLGRAIAVLITLVAEVLLIALVLALTLVPRVLDALRVGESMSASLRVVRLPAGDPRGLPDADRGHALRHPSATSGALAEPRAPRWAPC